LTSAFRDIACDIGHAQYDIVSELAMAMHQTTLRFPRDVWAALEDEAAHLGVSTAQYIREAAVARLAYGLGRRGDLGLETAIRGAGAPVSGSEWEALDAGTQRRHKVAVERAHEELSSSEALWAQGLLARERAREIRERLARQRRERAPLPPDGK